MLQQYTSCDPWVGLPSSFSNIGMQCSPVSKAASASKYSSPVNEPAGLLKGRVLIHVGVHIGLSPVLPTFPTLRCTLAAPRLTPAAQRCTSLDRKCRGC